MKPEIQAKLQKIKKVSSVFRAICKVMMVVIPLLGIGCVMGLVLGTGPVYSDDASFSAVGLSLGTRLLLGLVVAMTFCTVFKGYFHLHLLFGNYSRGDIFTRESVGQLRKFGIACLLWGVMRFLFKLTVAISAHPAKDFYFGHADSFIIGIIIIVIAWFMDMAVDLQEENELTI